MHIRDSHGAHTIIAASAPYSWLEKQFNRFVVADHSMAPLLKPGDRLITRLLHSRSLPRRGDLVVYEDGDRYLIKRIVGLPGERIMINGGIILIDGETFHDPWWSAATRPDGAWTLPADCWFVLGDNRPHSTRDSRSTGPVHVRDLHSVAVARYRPIRRIRRFPSPYF